jgi:hypothetical protein
MRPFAILVFVVALAAVSAQASVCETASGAKAAGPRWRVDHYIYDASLHRDWQVLIDCDRPAAPARMKLAPNLQKTPATATRTPAGHEGRSLPPAAPIGIKAGAAVEVLNSPNAPASIRLSGTAMQFAYRGQPVRVRLSATGTFVNGFVLGPHAVELVATTKPSWGSHEPF